MTLVNALWVGAGSCLGGMARYGVHQLISSHHHSVFPWHTFAVNVLGCFILGFIYGVIDRHFALSPGMRLFLTFGFCGGFTTFSTFINENFGMLNGGHLGAALLYTLGSVAVGLALLALGYKISI